MRQSGISSSFRQFEDYPVSSDITSYYFSVARQPDIVNTALLDEQTVTRQLTVRGIYSRLSSELAENWADTSVDLDISRFTCTSTELTVQGMDGESLS